MVVGGGNFFRGVQGLSKGLDRPSADAIGMLGTVMNALALEHAVASLGVPARAMSAVPMPSLCDSYTRRRALEHIVDGRVVIFLGGGTGNPFFTTDTAAALRAAELECPVLLKATNVDGVDPADPKKDPAAKRYERLTHREAIANDLKIMDTAAFALARDFGLNHHRVLDPGKGLHRQRSRRNRARHRRDALVSRSANSHALDGGPPKGLRRTSELQATLEEVEFQPLPSSQVREGVDPVNEREFQTRLTRLSSDTLPRLVRVFRIGRRRRFQLV